jgi:hypothetical protein
MYTSWLPGRLRTFLLWHGRPPLLWPPARGMVILLCCVRQRDVSVRCVSPPSLCLLMRGMQWHCCRCRRMWCSHPSLLLLLEYVGPYPLQLPSHVVQPPSDASKKQRSATATLYTSHKRELRQKRVCPPPSVVCRYLMNVIIIGWKSQLSPGQLCLHSVPLCRLYLSLF